jgi:hypothetical protein
VVKAAATNTGATTLNADGIAARPVKKVTGAGLVDLSAGDIQAAGIFIVEDDGTQFILLNPTPPSNLLTGPQFLAAGPAIIYASGPAVGWTTVAAGVLAGLGVPSNAKAVILQATLRWASATDGQAFANIRKDNVSFPLLLTRVGGTDAVATGSQAVFPITNTLQFDYQITESVPGVADGEIKLVGYYL